MPLFRIARVFLVAFVVCTVFVHAENWPNWRGPYYNGSTTETNLPDALTLDKNLAWKVAVPGRGGATPIIWGDKVLISSADDATKDLLAVCYDRKDGKELWKTKISSGDNAPRNGRNNMAGCSPVTDGNAVYFLYGNGDLAKLDMDGKIVWQQNITKDNGPLTIGWGYGSSPLLFKDKLYITVLRNHGENKAKPLDSFLLALNPKDGSVLWRHVRPSDANQETLETYATPMPVEVNGKWQLLINDGEYMTGHDADTGTELWRFGSFFPSKGSQNRMVVSPIAGGGNFYCNSAKQVSPIYAAKLGGSGTIKISDAAWTFDEPKMQPDCTTPLFYNDALFVINDKDVTTGVMKLDPKTGKKLWRGAIEDRSKGVFRASPTGGDGKIYMVRVTGAAYVVSAGDEFKILSELDLHEGSDNNGTVSSMSISQGNVFVRTPKTLYCFKK